MIATETDQDAQHLATTLQQQFLNLMRGNDVPLQPPVDDINELARGYKLNALQQQLGSSIVGSKQAVKEKMQTFLEQSQTDEIMAIAQVFDYKARHRLYEILVQITQSERHNR